MSDQNSASNSGKSMAPNAWAALVLGIISCLSGWIFGVPGIIFAVIGLLVGGNAKKAIAAAPSACKGEKLAKIGTTVSIVGLIQGILLAAVFAIVLVNSLINQNAELSFFTR